MAERPRRRVSDGTAIGSGGTRREWWWGVRSFGLVVLSWARMREIWIFSPSVCMVASSRSSCSIVYFCFLCFLGLF